MKNFLDYASKKYHEGSPVISDDEFDRLAEIHSYEKVGYSVQHGIPHHFPLYSLKKVYKGEGEIILGDNVTETPKLDGAAVSLLYVNGIYVRALTRGDGKRGEDITDKMAHLVPLRLKNSRDFIQIGGEVVAKKDIPNARNYAAGALNLKDISEFKKRELIFIAYSLTPAASRWYESDMSWLQQNDFNTVIDQDWKAYPQDGRVFRLNDNEKFEAAGFTSSHPRGAYALKERAEGVITFLRRVDWQVGRTGAVSPVGILDPVLIGGATVTRATLHNMRYIEELGLDIDCKVEVIRSGEIIPRIVRRVD